MPGWQKTPTETTNVLKLKQGERVIYAASSINEFSRTNDLSVKKCEIANIRVDDYQGTGLVIKLRWANMKSEFENNHILSRLVKDWPEKMSDQGYLDSVLYQNGACLQQMLDMKQRYIHVFCENDEIKIASVVTKSFNWPVNSPVFKICHYIWRAQFAAAMRIGIMRSKTQKENVKILVDAGRSEHLTFARLIVLCIKEVQNTFPSESVKFVICAQNTSNFEKANNTKTIKISDEITGCGRIPPAKLEELRTQDEQCLQTENDEPMASSTWADEEDDETEKERPARM